MLRSGAPRGTMIDPWQLATFQWWQFVDLRYPNKRGILSTCIPSSTLESLAARTAHSLQLLARRQWTRTIETLLLLLLLQDVFAALLLPPHALHTSRLLLAVLIRR